jgi:hypothetical protein
VTGSTEFDLGAGSKFGGVGKVIAGGGVAPVAGDSGLDDSDATALRKFGVAAEACPDGGMRLGNAKSVGRRAGWAGPVAESQVEAGRGRVVADAVFEPAAARRHERCDALIAGAEDPVDVALGGFRTAAGAHVEAAAVGSVGELKAVA